ncbi:hypothetical protein ACTXT7_012513 [Hymenolepis weldensis]
MHGAIFAQLSCPCTYISSGKTQRLINLHGRLHSSTLPVINKSGVQYLRVSLPIDNTLLVVFGLDRIRNIPQHQNIHLPKFSQ